MTQTHQCPVCGQETTGAYSEGGLRWALCDDCMDSIRDCEREERLGAMRMRQLDDGSRDILP